MLILCLAYSSATVIKTIFDIKDYFESSKFTNLRYLSLCQFTEYSNLGDWPNSLDCTDLKISLEPAVTQNCVPLLQTTNKQDRQYLFGGKDSTDITIEFSYVSFQTIYLYLDSTIWFWKKPKNIYWKRFYSIKKPLSYRALVELDCSWSSYSSFIHAQ